MFSVGILYSAQEFLKLIKETPSLDSNFPDFFTKFHVASPSAIFEVSQRCEWILTTVEGKLLITEKGEQIIQAKYEAMALRIQLGHLIETFHPTWLPILSYGRIEALKYLKPDIKQCFEEAGLFESETDDIVNWWDTNSKLARSERKDKNLEIGRRGEKLSIKHELERTKNKPIWTGLESNFAGFDILSIIDEHDHKQLRIEVKTSNSIPEAACLHLTKNEWDVACTSSYYIFHLWALQPKPKLFIVEIPAIRSHIPENTGEGEWETLKIPYLPFIKI